MPDKCAFDSLLTKKKILCDDNVNSGSFTLQEINDFLINHLDDFCDKSLEIYNTCFGGQLCFTVGLYNEFTNNDMKDDYVWLNFDDMNREIVRNYCHSRDSSYDITANDLQNGFGFLYGNMG